MCKVWPEAVGNVVDIILILFHIFMEGAMGSQVVV